MNPCGEVSAASAGGAASEVTVVIPTFNRSADVRRALRNLATQAGPALHVIVVDNSSTDNTAEMVQEEQLAWGGRLDYVRKDPQGPASARNVGLARATTPYVLFHDSDVELLPDWIEQARRRLENDVDVAAVGGYIVYAFEPGRVNAFGGDLSWFGLAWDVSEGELLPERHQPAERIWINCSAMLVRRDVALAAGAFDESFFYGFEDTDLGWRLRILGYRVVVLPELIAKHHVDAQPGATHPEIVFHYCKNRLRMLLRNAQTRRWLVVLGGYFLYSLVDLVLRGPKRPKLRALAWNIKRLPETWALRQAIQRRRITDDASIFSFGSGRWFPPTRLGKQRRRPVFGTSQMPNMASRSESDDRV